MTAVLLSVQPRFAESILSGRKTAEVRKRFPHLPPGTLLYLYSSTPTRAVIGTVEIVSITTATPTRGWDLHRDKLGITRAFYREYLAGRASATIIEVGCPNPWRSPVSLASLRTDLAIEPPQSYRYLYAEHEHTLRNLSS